MFSLQRTNPVGNGALIGMFALNVRVLYEWCRHHNFFYYRQLEENPNHHRLAITSTPTKPEPNDFFNVFDIPDGLFIYSCSAGRIKY